MSNVTQIYTFKHLLLQTTGPIKAKFHVELLLAEKLKVCLKYGLGHVSKMAAMPIYDKNPLKIFSKTRRLMTFKLGIQHQGLGPYKICSNDDPGLQQGQLCSPVLLYGKMHHY